MRAAVLRGSSDPFVIEDAELDAPRDDEVLVEVVAAGVCHTDLTIRHSGEPFEPIILGHEGAGIVREVGAGVTRVAVGDHVVMSFDACGWCASCLRGAPAYCAQFEQRNFSGRRLDGTTGGVGADGAEVSTRWFGQSSFAEFSIATERNVVVVDPDLPLDLLGPLGCGLQTGAGAVLNEMRLAPGQSIAVFGAGAVGLSAVMAAALAGAGEIVIVDRHDSRLEVALELGATRAVRGDVDDLVAEVRGAGDGFDFALETTSADAVVAAAVRVLGVRGRAILTGAGHGDLRIAPAELAGRTVGFSIEGGSVPQLFVPELIRHWQAGRFPFERFATVYPLEEINRAEADSSGGTTIKPILRIGG